MIHTTNLTDSIKALQRSGDCGLEMNRGVDTVFISIHTASN